MRDFHHNMAALDQRASGTITVNDYTGLSGKTITVEGNVLTEGVDFNAVTDNDTTAGNIATAIAALSGFTASSSGAVVTLYWETPGTAGNAKTLATNDAVNLTLSGATLSGGVDATYTDRFLHDNGNFQDKEMLLDITTLGGTTPTVDVTPQYSLDGGDTWKDHTAFTQKTGISSQTIDESLVGVATRFKIVLGGTNPICTGKISCIVK